MFKHDGKVYFADENQFQLGGGQSVNVTIYIVQTEGKTILGAYRTLDSAKNDRPYVNWGPFRDGKCRGVWGRDSEETYTIRECRLS